MAVSTIAFTDIIMEQYAEQPTFLDAVSNDLSALVDNNKINLSEAGVEPEVYIDNTGDIGTDPRPDTDVELSLKTADSKNTVVKNIEALEASYDKIASVTRGHARAIMRKIAAHASWSFAPSATGVYTPVIPTTGTVVGGFKQMTEDDIWILKQLFDDVDAPLDRTLVLHATHFNQVVKGSETLKEQRKYLGVLGKITTQFLECAGFKIYQFKGGAVYNKTTGVKKAFGAAATPSTDTIASFAFCDGEVMKCYGDTTMFAREKDPEKRGDIMGFQRRFLAMPMRNKYLGAIYSGV